MRQHTHTTKRQEYQDLCKYSVGETSEKRTLRISPAECEGAIEELSKAMEEGFSAMLDELVEDFDKPGGIGDMIDKSFERYECFEKLDKLEKKLESDECVRGKWDSEKCD